MGGHRVILTAVAIGAISLGQMRAEPAGGPASQPATARPSSPLTGTAPAARLIRVDRAKRQVAIDAAVSLRDGLLEFVLCKEGTRDYESLLSTKAEPSSLHAALLALGLRPGRPAQWVTAPGKEPVFVPPRGAALEVRLRWTDADGKPHESRADDWLLVASTKKPPAEPIRWVFIGSDFLDNGRYWADVEGQIISVANFAASVLDVPFKSTDKNALLEYVANPRVVPPKGTPVEVVLTVAQGAETAPAARMSFVIDHLGRIEIDGAPTPPEGVAPAVKRFLAQHSEGAADVRVDPRALVYDQDRLKDILQEAGMAEVAIRPLTINEEILPRTAAQSARAVAWWKQQFAQARELLVDPAEDAAVVVENIERRRQEIQALSELWSDYAAQLRALIEQHRATTQPQTRPANP